MIGFQTVALFAAALILLACRYDTRRQLSLFAMISAVVCGFVAMNFVGHLDDFAFGIVGDATALVTRAASIAVVEESSKLLAIVVLAVTFFHARVREPLDGLLLGQLVGLGMGLDESLLYVRLDPHGIQTLGMEIVRLFAHALMAGIIGFGVGCVRSSSVTRPQASRCLLLCVSLTTAIHFSWNVVAYAHETTLPAHLIPMLLMLALMLLWKTFCTIAQRHATATGVTTVLHQTA